MIREQYTIKLAEGDLASILALLEQEKKMTFAPDYWNNLTLEIRQQVNFQLAHGLPCGNCQRRLGVLNRLGVMKELNR